MTSLQCMNTPEEIDVNSLINSAQNFADDLYNDPTNDLAHDKVYIFQGGFRHHNFYQFDQRQFFTTSIPGYWSLDTIGYVYVPSACVNGEECKLHLALHGCQQGRQNLGTTFATQTGYREVAELNNIIVLFPQAISTPSNPYGCWDWWGYNTYIPQYVYDNPKSYSNFLPNESDESSSRAPPPIPNRSSTQSRDSYATSSGASRRTSSNIGMGANESASETEWQQTVPPIGDGKRISWANEPRIYVDCKSEQNNMLDYPCAVAISPVDGSIYVTDVSRCEVIRISPDGQLLGLFGSRGVGNGQFEEPRGIAVTSSGRVIVSDAKNSCIQLFEAHGQFIRKFGSFGHGRGQFHGPAGLCCPDDNTLYVADQFNNRIQKCSLDGRFTETFGMEGTVVGNLRRPTDVAVNSDGHIFVVDSNNNRIQVWKPDQIQVIGTNGSGKGQFNHPISLAIDCRGLLVIADELNFRVQVLRETGEFVRSFGKRGDDVGEFDQLAGVAISPLDNGIVVIDSYNRTIQIF
ncbi:hypothetical protein LSH36_138g07011 [Paralvinella palmiformis]|uniref:Uncharacterized protein n=1 Tax=Paralvinella palmiformis TaxID=53620 RepID=A0AAD9JWB5_9ANNE|nr:hypothetical protein LSH36_138g07011 [Paralvinella palmiformis]